MADVVCMDVPLLTRIMEECHEGVESDAELHFMLTKMIEQQQVKGSPLTMDDYGQIMQYKEKFNLLNDKYDFEEY